MFHMEGPKSSTLLANSPFRAGKFRISVAGKPKTLEQQVARTKEGVGRTHYYVWHLGSSLTVEHKRRT